LFKFSFSIPIPESVTSIENETSSDDKEILIVPGPLIA
jgi:hypothetical protein